MIRRDSGEIVLCPHCNEDQETDAEVENFVITDAIGEGYAQEPQCEWCGEVLLYGGRLKAILS